MPGLWNLDVARVAVVLLILAALVRGPLVAQSAPAGRTTGRSHNVRVRSPGLQPSRRLVRRVDSLTPLVHPAPASRAGPSAPQQLL